MEGAHRRREARIERLNGSPLNAGAGFLGVPIVSTTFPSVVHLRTACPKSSVR